MQGSTSTALTHVADIYPTFCAFAGIDPDDEKAEQEGLPPVDGVDLSPIINGSQPLESTKHS